MWPTAPAPPLSIVRGLRPMRCVRVTSGAVGVRPARRKTLGLEAPRLGSYWAAQWEGTKKLGRSRTRPPLRNLGLWAGFPLGGPMGVDEKAREESH